MLTLDNSFTLVPPLVAIGVALWRKNAIVALGVGLGLTWLMDAGLNPVAGTVAIFGGLKAVLSSSYHQMILFFSLLVGSLLALMKHSGGVSASIALLSRRNWVNNPRQAGMLPVLIGSSIFTDTNLSLFTSGIASQALFDKFGLSRARLAYILDSTCSPISILLLLNGWGAYLLGLLQGYGVADTVGLLIDATLFNVYPMIVLAMVYYTAWSTKVYGPLARSLPETTRVAPDSESSQPGRARYMIAPIVALTLMAVTLLLYTGGGDIRAGNGALAVMWAVIVAWGLLLAMLLADRVFSLSKLLSLSVTGMKQLLPAAVVLVLSFAFGDAVKAYGTGDYISSALGAQFPQVLIAPLLFVIAGAMAFATGTSWGTFAVLIPIAMPMADSTGLPASLLVAAVLGGGVFGDHSSPISDSTIIASLASGCEHLEHVRTQLPYNLLAAGLSVLVYGLLSVLYS